LAISNITAISAGYNHNLALKSDGTVWAWGLNSSGQLGDGTNANRTTPVQISGLTGVTAISGGYLHSLALKSDGTVWAWGSNNYGELSLDVLIDIADALGVSIAKLFEFRD
jgi:alpha-tubulin suppressor-like RCC1 family protein